MNHWSSFSSPFLLYFTLNKFRFSSLWIHLFFFLLIFSLSIFYLYLSNCWILCLSNKNLMITSYDLEKKLIERGDLSSIVLDNIARSSIDLWQSKIFFLDRKYPKFQFQCSHRNEPRLCAQTDSSTILLMNPKSSSFFLKILYCFEENQVSRRWNDHVGC
jgi:hypothetical protein